MSRPEKPRRNSYGAVNQDNQIFSFSRKKAIEFFRRECELRLETTAAPSKTVVMESGHYDCKYMPAERKYTFRDSQSHVHEPEYRFHGARRTAAAVKSMSLDRGHSLDPDFCPAGDPHASKAPTPKRTQPRERTLHGSQFLPIQAPTLQEKKGRHQKTKSLDQNSTFLEHTKIRQDSQKSTHEARPGRKPEAQDPRNPFRAAGKRLSEPAYLCRQARSSSIDCVNKSPELHPSLQGSKHAPSKERRWGVDRAVSVHGARGSSVHHQTQSVGQTRHLSTSDYNVNTATYGVTTAVSPRSDLHRARYASVEQVSHDQRQDCPGSYKSTHTDSGLTHNFPECHPTARQTSSRQGRDPFEYKSWSPDMTHKQGKGAVSQTHDRSLDRNDGLLCPGYGMPGIGRHSPKHRGTELGNALGNPGGAYNDYENRPLKSAFTPLPPRPAPRKAKCMSLDHKCHLPELTDSFPVPQNPISVPPRRRNSFQRPRGRLWDNQYSFQEIHSTFQQHCSLTQHQATGDSVNTGHSSHSVSQCHQKHGSDHQKYGLPNQVNRMQKPEYGQRGQRDRLEEQLHQPAAGHVHKVSAGPQRRHSDLWIGPSDVGFTSQHPEYQKAGQLTMARLPRSISTVTQNGSVSSEIGSGDDNTKASRKKRGKKSVLSDAKSKKSNKSAKLPNSQKVVSGPHHHSNKPDANLQTGRASQKVRGHQKVKVGYRRRKGKLRGFDLISCCYGIPSRQDRHDNAARQTEQDQHQVRFWNLLSWWCHRSLMLSLHVDLIL